MLFPVDLVIVESNFLKRPALSRRSQAAEVGCGVPITCLDGLFARVLKYGDKAGAPYYLLRYNSGPTAK